MCKVRFHIMFSPIVYDAGAPPMTSVLSLKDCSAIAMVYSVEDAQSWKYIEQQLMSQLK